VTPAALPKPGRGAPGHNAEDRNRNDEDKHRQGNSGQSVGRIEGVERHRHQMTVCEREHDEKDTERDQDQAGQEFTHDLSRDVSVKQRSCWTGSLSISWGCSPERFLCARFTRSILAIEPLAHFLAGFEKRYALLIDWD